jgi:hypothetical protein
MKVTTEAVHVRLRHDQGRTNIMKKLVMSALLLGAFSMATGCIFVSDDSTDGDDDVPGGTGSVTATWGVTPGCQPGEGASVTIVADNIDDNIDPYEDIYDCADGAGSMDQLPLGDYDIWLHVETYDFDSGELWASTDSVVVEDALLADGDIIDIEFSNVPLPGEGIALSWDLRDAGDTVSLDCADFPTENGVSVLSTLAGTADGIDDIFDCEYGLAPLVAVTSPMDPGDYVVSVALLEGEVALATSDDINTTVVLDDYTDLGVVEVYEN